jgi:hypothetical protein
MAQRPPARYVSGQVMNRFLLRILALPCLLAMALRLPALPPADPAHAAPIPATIDFSRDILPVISSKCFHCHGPDEGHRSADLRLDVRDEAVAARKGVQAIKPGDLKASELIARITTTDEDDVMPPPKERKPLTPREIELFKKWIEQGAAYAAHWAFVKPERPGVPRIQQSGVRIQNPIDNFIVAKLYEQKIKQSTPADPHTLIRRLSLDLTGLPPTPEEVEAFLKDCRSASGNSAFRIPHSAISN